MDRHSAGHPQSSNDSRGISSYRIATDCPICGASLAVKHTRQTGALFLGCTGYPNCRFAEDYDAALQSIIASGLAHPPPRGICPDLLLGRLKGMVAQLHPDKFGGSDPAATEAIKLLLQLRDDVQAGDFDIEQVEQCQSQRGSSHRGRLALVAGLTSLSLLGAGFVLQSSWISGKLREYTANSVASSRTVLPHSPGVREPPLLPHSPGVRELPHSVQGGQTTVFAQFLTGKPLTVSLPQLQRTPEAFPVRVKLDVSDSLPMWLNFDAKKLALSGTAPPQETGKTYHLTFRAYTADGLESLLHCVLAIR